MVANNQLEEQRKTIDGDAICSLRSILYEQMVFNTSKETHSITKVELKHSSYSKELTYHRKNSFTTIQLKSDRCCNQITYNQISYHVRDIGDVVCLGATLVIIVILMSVLYYCYLYIGG